MPEDIAEIRRQKMDELREQAETGGAAEAATKTQPDPIHVSGDAELSDVVAEYDVVLADFYADWCGPCQMLEPIVETIAADTDATVAKIDIDANQQLAATYSVQGVPTLLLFADGERVEEVVGLKSEAELRALIGAYTD